MQNGFCWMFLALLCRNCVVLFYNKLIYRYYNYVVESEAISRCLSRAPRSQRKEPSSLSRVTVEPVSPTDSVLVYNVCEDEAQLQLMEAFCDNPAQSTIETLPQPIMNSDWLQKPSALLLTFFDYKGLQLFCPNIMKSKCILYSGIFIYAMRILIDCEQSQGHDGGALRSLEHFRKFANFY